MNSRTLALSVLALGVLHFSYDVLITQKDQQMRNLLPALKLLYELQSQYQHPYMQISKDFRNRFLQYDLQKLVHPDTQLEDFYIFRAIANDDSIRDAIRTFHFDAAPHIEIERYGTMNRTLYDKTPFTQIWFPMRFMGMHELIERQSLFVKFMRLSEPLVIFKKSLVANLQRTYLQNLKNHNASQKCLRDAQYQKKSYLQQLDLSIRLWEQSSCLAFWKKANAALNDGQDEIQYIIKSNQHNGSGIILANQSVLSQLALEYQNGERCRYLNNTVVNANAKRANDIDFMVKSNYKLIAQEFIKKPLILEGRKFDFRIYLLIVSTEPLIAYHYGHVYINQCSIPRGGEFNEHQHICNLAMLRRRIELLTKAQNHEELKKFKQPKDLAFMLTIDEFQQRLQNDGYALKEDWGRKYLIPEMTKKFAHYFNSALSHKEHQISRDLRIGEYAGCDFDINQNFELFLLECTMNPNFRLVYFPQVLSPIKMMHNEGLYLLKKYSSAKFIRLRELIQKLKIWSPKEVQNNRLFILDKLRDKYIPGLTKNFYYIDFDQGLSSCQKYY